MSINENRMFKELSSMFRKRSSKVLAQQALEESKISLLELKDNREYYQYMEQCMETRIKRLKQYLSNEG
jgi:hypothetical protein